jgi:regulator of protease activity HflC (stomatin/prohibitin superfamily)
MEVLFTFIVELLKAIWGYLSPIYVHLPYEFGVVTRWGKFHRLAPAAGWYWKWPVAEDTLSCFNTMTTEPIDAQSFNTIDGKEIVVEGVVKYKVEDPRKFLLDVTDVKSAITDITQGVIFEMLSALTLEECRKDATRNAVEIKIRRQQKEWGISVERFTFKTLVATRTYRIIKNADQYGSGVGL